MIPSNVSEYWYNQASKKIDELVHAFCQKNNPREFICHSKISHLDFDLQPQGLHSNGIAVGPTAKGWEIVIELAGITKAVQNWDTNNFIPTDPGASKLRFIYHHFEVEYLNQIASL